LERWLFTPAGFHEGSTKPLPDWTKVHEELKRRGVTLMILWEEHRAAYVDGHGYSRYVAAKFMLRERLCFGGSPAAGAVLTQHNPVPG
jgi:transposase